MASGVPTKPKKNKPPVGSPGNPSEIPKLNKPVTPSTPIVTKPSQSGGGSSSQPTQPQPSDSGYKTEFSTVGKGGTIIDASDKSKIGSIVKKGGSSSQPTQPQRNSEIQAIKQELYGPPRPPTMMQRIKAKISG